MDRLNLFPPDVMSEATFGGARAASLGLRNLYRGWGEKSALCRLEEIDFTRVEQKLKNKLNALVEEVQEYFIEYYKKVYSTARAELDELVSANLDPDTREISELVDSNGDRENVEDRQQRALLSRLLQMNIPADLESHFQGIVIGRTFQICEALCREVGIDTREVSEKILTSMKRINDIAAPKINERMKVIFTNANEKLDELLERDCCCFSRIARATAHAVRNFFR